MAKRNKMIFKRGGEHSFKLASVDFLGEELCKDLNAASIISVTLKASSKKIREFQQWFHLFHSTLGTRVRDFGSSFCPR